MATRKKTAGTDISTKIADQIHELITRGVLSPGVHLGQTELAERFNTSRIPVREALKLLTADGIIVHNANRGFFIAELSSDEVTQLYQMRNFMEAAVINNIEWPGKAQLAYFKTQVKKLDALVEVDRFKWTAAHREFHTAVLNLSTKKLLVSEALRLWTLTDRYRSLMPVEMRIRHGAPDEHHAIITALTKQDRVGILKIFEQNRSRVEKQLIGILETRGL